MPFPRGFYCPIEDVSGLFLSCSAIQKGFLICLLPDIHGDGKRSRRSPFAEETTTSNLRFPGSAFKPPGFSMNFTPPGLVSAGRESPQNDWENFRLFQTLLVKIYDHSNRAISHRNGGIFLLLFINANGFQAQCRKNCWCWDGETPASEDFMLKNFPLTWRIRVSELLWMALLLFMTLHEQTHTFKHV